MDLATMRLRVARAMGHSSADDIEGGQDRVDEALDAIWRFDIPDRISDAAAAGYFDITTVAGTETYSYDVSHPQTVKMVTGPVYIGDNELEYTTEVDEFYYRFRRTDAARARPAMALAFGRSISLRPLPDAVYTVRVYGRLYRASLSAGTPADLQESLALIFGAAHLIAAETHDDVLMKRNFDLYDRQLISLSRRYRGATPERNTYPAGDF